MFSKLTACSPIWDYMIPQFLWPCWREFIAKEESWLPEKSGFFVNDIDDSPMCILLSGCHSGPDQRSCLSCALPYFPTEHQTYLKPPITSTIVDIIYYIYLNLTKLNQTSCLSCALSYFPTEHQSYLQPSITFVTTLSIVIANCGYSVYPFQFDDFITTRLKIGVYSHSLALSR